MFGIIAGVVGSIVAAAGSVVKALAVTGLAVDGLMKVGGVLLNLAKFLGLIKPQIQIDELGDKAIQSGYDPEQYDTYAKYVEAVEAFDSLDPERSKHISEEDKIKRGMELATGVMIERYQDFPIDKFCVEIGKRPDFFAENAIKKVGEMIIKSGDFISDILGYLNGTEKNDSKLEEMVGSLSDVCKADNPNLSDDEIADIVFGLRG